MQFRVTSFCALLVLSVTSVSADPLSSHYGGGADPRKQELFVCKPSADAIACTIESLRSDGQRVAGSFTASYDGKPRPVTGIPDMDQVVLRKIDESIADATFSFRGKPVFAYRAVRSADGRSLTIVSVDPVTRRVGSSVIVYDRDPE